MQRPFRTRLHHATADEIDAANAALRPDPPFEALDVEIDRILTESRVPASVAQRWALHPDERVPMAAIRTRTDGMLRHEAYEARPTLERALHDADAEGVVWTPLLETLAASRRWPYPDPQVPGADAFPRPHDRAAGLGTWISAQTDPAANDELLRTFPSRVVRMVWAEHATVLSKQQIENVAGDGDLLRALLLSGRIPPADVEQLLLRLFALTSGLVEGARANAGLIFPEIVATLEGPAAQAALRVIVHEIVAADQAEINVTRRSSLLRHIAAAKDVPSDALDEVLVHGHQPKRTARFMHETNAESLFLHPNTSLETWRRVLLSPDFVIPSSLPRRLLLNKAITPERVQVVFEAFQAGRTPPEQRQQMLRDFIDGPQTPPEVFRAIAAEHRDFTVRSWLSQSPRARADAAVCDALLESTSSAVLISLVKGPEAPQEPALTAVLRLFNDCETVSLAHALQERFDKAGSVDLPLPSQLVTTLLMSEIESVRRTGLSVVGSMEPPEPGAAPRSSPVARTR